jgi:hypothetical protein
MATTTTTTLLDLPHEVLSIILYKTSALHENSAKNLVTSCKQLWWSDTLSGAITVMRVEVPMYVTRFPSKKRCVRYADERIICYCIALRC